VPSSIAIERAAEASTGDMSPEPGSVPWWWPVTVVVIGSAFVRIWLTLAGNRFENYELHPSVWHLVEPDRLAANPLAMGLVLAGLCELAARAVRARRPASRPR
jgi:hypothetical protein